MSNNEITLNSLEHYIFCPYQWWLIYVENEWAENIHTVQGDIVHAKVDDAHFYESRGATRIERSVPLFSEKFRLYGIADLMEFIYNGDKLKNIKVVEYKKGLPSDNGEVTAFDGLQLYAQMVCAREIFGCEVDGYIYYASIRKRVKLKNEEVFDNLLQQTLTEMREFQQNGCVPVKNKGKHCNACSMKEVCLPFVGGHNA